MTVTPSVVPTRRSLLAGALGVGTLGSIAAASPAAAALGDPSIPTNPTVDFHLALSGIPGDDTTIGFENQITLLTWAWGVASPVATGGGGGGAIGRPVPEEFVFAGRSGIHSPRILTALNTGRRLQRALLSCTRPTDGSAFTFMTLRFEDCQLTGYDVTPGATDGFPLDVVSLAFARITYRVTTQNPDGSAGDTVSSTFDYRTNTA